MTQYAPWFIVHQTKGAVQNHGSSINTIGKKIKKLKPEEVADIHILDPACGSGSFLIGAYDYLLRFHLQYYLKTEKTKNTALKQGIIYQLSNNKFKLSTSTKSQLLVNNIYGVDIDEQAVEVTKLSLLLKVLEDENLEYKEELFKAEHHHLLPDLSNNIKCGNSLIEDDYYECNELPFDINNRRRVNSFTWKKNFSIDIKFDCIIGNPPYIQQSMYENFDATQKQYLLDKYCSSMGRLNTFGFFIEKGIKLLNKNGYFSFIVPNTFLTQEYYAELRAFILKNISLDSIVHYEEMPFEDAVVEATTFVFSNNSKMEMV